MSDFSVKCVIEVFGINDFVLHISHLIQMPLICFTLKKRMENLVRNSYFSLS